MSETTDSKRRIEELEALSQTLENVLKLSEKELSNALEIIKMYESICEYGSNELKDARETAAAGESVSELGSAELKKAFSRITELEAANCKLREESVKLKN